MSDKNNDVYFEEVQARFNEAVNEKNWDEIRKLSLELEERGFPEKEIELINSLSEEDTVEYRAWDKRVNGDTAAQMDDDSDEEEDEAEEEEV